MFNLYTCTLTCHGPTCSSKGNILRSLVFKPRAILQLSLIFWAHNSIPKSNSKILKLSQFLTRLYNNVSSIRTLIIQNNHSLALPKHNFIVASISNEYKSKPRQDTKFIPTNIRAQASGLKANILPSSYKLQVSDLLISFPFPFQHSNSCLILSNSALSNISYGNSSRSESSDISTSSSERVAELSPCCSSCAISFSCSLCSSSPLL